MEGTFADGASVTAIADFSGNSNTATPAGTTNRPTFRSGSNGQNGHGVIQFDGVDDYATFASAITLSDDHTAVAVVYRTATTNRVVPLAGLALESYPQVLWPDGKRYSATKSPATYSLVNDASTGWHVMAVARSGTSATFYTDGAVVTAGAAGPISASGGGDILYTGARAGTTSYMQGKIAENLFYNRVLTTQELTDLHSYLRNKWATP